MTLDLLALIGVVAGETADEVVLSDLRRRLSDTTIVEYCSDNVSLAHVRDWVASPQATDPATTAKALDRVARSICSQAFQEAALIERAIVNSDRKLARTEYKYVVWYDILDSRARKHGLPDNTNKYATAVDEFRAAVNTLLDDAMTRLRATGCNMFCDTGDIRSLNDEKHVFLAGPGTMEEEANRLSSDIMRICARTGVSARLIATPTDLRGQPVFLNRGTTSIDGDFKSHLHTMIDTLKTHDVEKTMNDGDAVLWLLQRRSKEFVFAGGLEFERVDAAATTVEVNIRGFSVKTSVIAVLSKATISAY